MVSEQNGSQPDWYARVKQQKHAQSIFPITRVTYTPLSIVNISARLEDKVKWQPAELVRQAEIAGGGTEVRGSQPDWDAKVEAAAGKDRTSSQELRGRTWCCPCSGATDCGGGSRTSARWGLREHIDASKAGLADGS